MAGQTINVSVLADTRQFKTAMAGLGQQTGLSRLASGAKAAGAALLRVGAAATVAAGVAVVKLGKDAIGAASDLQQSSGAIETVFKGNAGTMHTWAAGAATSVGLTKNEFNELGTLIGTQLKNGGTAMADLAPKTNQLITLGADLSSMFGGSTKEAVEALSSALKGERDPIERYGVSLNQAKIDAEAAHLGFKKVGGSLSTEANQAATLSLIMKQTADAHGNFGRESDTLAHQQQVLKASLGNVSAELGTKLLPAATAATSWIGSKIPAASAAASRAMATIGPVLRTVADGAKAAMAGFQGKAPTVDLGPWTSKLAAAGAAARTAFDGAKAAISGVASFIGGTLVPALTSSVSWLGQHKTAVAAIAGPFLALAAAAKAYQVTITVIKTAQAAYNTVMGTAKALQAAYAFGTYGQITANQGLLATQAGLLGAARQWIASLAAGAASIARQTAALVAQGAVWVAQRAAMLAHAAASAAVRVGQLAMAGAQAALNVVMSMNPIGLVVIALAALAAGLMYAYRHSETFRNIVNAAFRVVKAAATALAGGVMSALRAIGSGLSSAASTVSRWAGTVRNGFVRTWTGARTATTSGINAVVSFVRGLPGRAAGAMSAIGGRIRSVLSSAWSSARSATSSGISSLLGIVRGLPGRVVGALSGMASRTASIGRQIISGMVHGVLSAAGNLASAAARAVSSAISAAKSKLGIHSPSRVFAEIGAQTIAGMVKGLDAGRSHLAAAGDRIADTVTSTATPSPGVPGISGGGSPITVTINAGMLQPDAAAAHTLARLLTEQIRELHRRGVALA